MGILRNCCCGCTLHTGCRVIAILEIIGCILGIISAATGMGQVNISLHNLPSGDPATTVSPEDIAKLVDVIRGIMIANIVYNVVFLIIASLLLYGVNTRQRQYFFPHIIAQGIGIVFLFIGGITAIAVLHEGAGLAVGIAVFLVMMVASLIQIYFLLVVISLYQELNESMAGGNPTIQAQPYGGYKA